MNWKQQLATIGSNDQIAKRLLQQLDEADPRKALPYRTLGAKVGALLRGDDGWWRLPRNETLREAVALLASSDVADIFADGQEDEPPVWGFREFPALRPIDPTQERWVCGTAVRFAAVEPAVVHDIVTVGLTATGPNWVEAPDGGGKSFALKWAAVRGLTVLDVETVADAVRELDGKRRCVVRVRHPEPASDPQALSELQQFAVTVLASFGRPDRATSPGGHFTPNILSAMPKVTGMDESRAWSDWRWVASPAVRAEFLNWACLRVPLTSALGQQAGEIVNWLDELDPSATEFAGPGNLLWVLARIEGSGLSRVKSGGVRGLLTLMFQQKAKALTQKAPTVANWLLEQGDEALRQIALNRLSDLALPVGGPLSTQQWSSLAPQSPVEPDPEDIRALIESGSDPEVLVAMFASPQPEAIISRLHRAGLLTESADDRLTLGPPWLAQQLYRDAARRLVLDPADHGWARLCLSPERRPIVDGALADVCATAGDLTRYLGLISDRSTTVVEIACIDAWFIAIGRLLLDGATVRIPTDELQRLATLAASRWVCTYKGSPRRIPVSRLDAPGTDTATHEWLACAWAWSVHVPKPVEIDDEFPWVFPGWFRQALSTAPRDLPYDGEYTAQMTNLVGKFTSVAPADAPAPDGPELLWNGFALALLQAGFTVPLREGNATWNQLPSPPGALLASGGRARMLGAFGWDADVVLPALSRWGTPMADVAIRRLAESVVLTARPLVLGLIWWIQETARLGIDMPLPLDPEQLVAALAEPGGHRAGTTPELVLALPPRTHLAVLEYLGRQFPKDTEILAWKTQSVLALSPEADEWLALRHGHHAARSWAQRRPVRALSWLQTVGLEHPVAEDVLSMIPAEQMADALNWAETQAGTGADGLLALWALRGLAARPDLAERWWGLYLRVAAEKDARDATAGAAATPD